MRYILLALLSNALRICKELVTFLESQQQELLEQRHAGHVVRNSGNNTKGGNNSNKRLWCFGFLSTKEVLLIAFSGGLCFYSGIIIGVHVGLMNQYTNNNNNNAHSNNARIEARFSQGVLDFLLLAGMGQHVVVSGDDDSRKKKFDMGIPLDDDTTTTTTTRIIMEEEEEEESRLLLFPKGVSDFLAGMVYVSRDNFTSRFDMGVPLDKTKLENDRVLILYNGPKALPKKLMHKRSNNNNNKKRQKKKQKSNKNHNHNHNNNPEFFTSQKIMDNVDEALENCEVLNVILTQPRTKKQCMAIMGQYQSYHIQKFTRIPSVGKQQGKALKVNHTLPLRHVNRNAKTGGGLSVKIPKEQDTREAWDVLSQYLISLPQVLKDLRPIAAKAAENSPNNNTIIVMVCNFGQSELLANFVCNARHRNFHSLLKTVLVFATDIETKELAQGMGLNVFYDQVNFERFPKHAAQRYADPIFSAVMMAKVYCVQMINMLGYDLLFQDVDMIWYRNPIPYFLPNKFSNNTTGDADDNSSSSSASAPVVVSPLFDMYFQDDGNHGSYYAPYSANTGFYYVRYNERTRYFFSTLLQSGDLISSTKSHQVAVISLLAEHASMYGLRVKVLSREKFPGGFHYNRKDSWPYMRQWLKLQQQQQQLAGDNSTTTDRTSKKDNNVPNPYMFHMSWTTNKHIKLKYFQQMGEWYLNNDKCLQQPASKIILNNDGKNNNNTNILFGELIRPCCLIEPNFQCHYRDKPSLYSCKESPPIDKDGKSFWP